MAENLCNNRQPIGFLEADGRDYSLQAVHAFVPFRMPQMYLAPSKADSAT
jgi:hypothetical protein